MILILQCHIDGFVRGGGLHKISLEKSLKAFHDHSPKTFITVFLEGILIKVLIKFVPRCYKLYETCAQETLRLH